MECGACKYNESTGIFRDALGNIEYSKDKFIKIQGSFNINIDSNYGGTYKEEVSLWACPICNTIQMKRW